MSNEAGDSAARATGGETVPAPVPPPAPSAEAPPPEAEGEAQLLVSEFPPPPFYYPLASQRTSDGTPLLTPPPIPHDALKVAAKKAAEIAADAAKAAEAERFASLGTAPAADAEAKPSIKIDGSDAPEAMDGDVVAVFGEIVEDPMLVEVQDECDNPEAIKTRLNELNKEVLAGFVKLVNELVHNPLDNKKCRDEVSHNLFLMIQEANKYREHQARELLIDILEKQVEERKAALNEIQTQVTSAKATLQQLDRSSSMQVD